MQQVVHGDECPGCSQRPHTIWTLTSFPITANPSLRIITEDLPFSFAVVRDTSPNDDDTAPCLFNTSGHRLLFKDEYIELTTSIAHDAALYGLGERTVSAGLRAARSGIPRTIWARDFGAMYPDANLYGVYPMYLSINPTGTLLFFGAGKRDLATHM